MLSGEGREREREREPSQLSERRLCKAEAGASGGRLTFNRHLSGLRGWGWGWVGGSFHASPLQGSLICWPTRGITTNTTSRSGRSRPPAAASGSWGCALSWGRSTPRGCLPQCLPKGGVFGLDGLTPAARARSRSLASCPRSKTDPRIGKILEISHVISYNRVM